MNVYMYWSNFALFLSWRQLCSYMTPPGPRLNIKTVFPRYGIPMLKKRRSRDRLIFNMGIAILVIRHLYIKTAPRHPLESHQRRLNSLRMSRIIYHVTTQVSTSLRPSEAYMIYVQHWFKWWLVAYSPITFGAKPLSGLMLCYCNLDLYEYDSV